MSRKKAKVESKVTQESKVEEAAAGQGSNDFDRQAQTEEDVAAASADQGSSRDTCEEQADGLATELEQLRGELAAANDRYLPQAGRVRQLPASHTSGTDLDPQPSTRRNLDTTPSCA